VQAALAQLLGDEDAKRKAAAYGKELRQWNGPKNAAEAIWQRYGKGDMA
jgi:UDP:flavonoid glycosyltransferase YjiC (YdhE family)